MAGFILGHKNNQSQMFNEAGKIMPVTTITTNPCYLVDVKWPEVDGYAAVKLGIDETKKIAKPVKGQLLKAGIQASLRFLKEFRIDIKKTGATAIEEEGKKGIQIGEVKMFIGDIVTPAIIFKIGEIVDVSGISKGKGFQGVVRRYGFAGGPKTHGQSDRHRAPGSVGSGTTPGRVFKGQRMAGQTGRVRITVQKLTVVAADDTSVTVKGLIPGNKGGLVEVKTHGI